ncbi:MAG: DNA mismatch repair endonuclease MutL [Clostridia bacterium]|nr:DNA mismatch repair endonuclease MutL [Clostridia bacterium]
MPRILQLDPNVANMIAAGEVVERPGSAAKELIENAVDAGAKNIIVEIRNGGVAYLRVTDDGCGIAEEDVRTAFMRHATSKIRTEKDLAAIGTLGFRGEALAAIASVAKVDMFTKTQDAQEGVQISIEGGEETGFGATGCPNGTTVVIRELFYNIPARAKFLKKDATEASYIETAVINAAIARPDIAFKLIRDGRECFATRGDGKTLNAVYAAHGKDVAESLISMAGSLGRVSVDGMITIPQFSRANRSLQTFFVNGRVVKSKTLSAAIDQAYKGKIMPGRYPACFINLHLDLSAVDVNVHPSKLEVKFSREGEIFSAVSSAVSGALDSLEEMRSLRRSEGAVREDNVTEMQQSIAVPPRPTAPVYTHKESFGSSVSRLEDSTPKLQYKTKLSYENIYGRLRENRQTPPAAEEKPLPAAEPASDAAPASELTPREEEKKNPAAEMQAAELPDIRMAGELFDTYLIVQLRDEVWLIDKHAAHEKIIFNRLKEQTEEQAMQSLLAPETVTLSAAEKAVCLEHAELLRRAGFETEDFGTGKLLVRSAPMYLEAGDIGYVISDIAEKLMQGKYPESELFEEILMSVSCRAAIKGGDKNDARELEKLAQTVISDIRVRNCPHGRPVAVQITRRELEKRFKRVL